MSTGREALPYAVGEGSGGSILHCGTGGGQCSRFWSRAVGVLHVTNEEGIQGTV